MKADWDFLIGCILLAFLWLWFVAQQSMYNAELISAPVCGILCSNELSKSTLTKPFLIFRVSNSLGVSFTMKILHSNNHCVTSDSV